LADGFSKVVVGRELAARRLTAAKLRDHGLKFVGPSNSDKWRARQTGRALLPALAILLRRLVDGVHLDI